jgi:hypothetical protein
MIADAQKAIHALLFQFWKGDFNEGTEASLDIDMEKSALMFFTRIRKYVDRGNSVQSMSPDRAYKGMGSLGARLDSVEPPFQAALAVKGLPTNTSFYEVILQALRDRDQVVQGGFLPKTKTAILQWQREAMFTLQMRHNHLPMMVLSRMSDFADRGIVGRGVMLLVGAKFNLNSSDPEMKISNALLVEMTKWLDQASETRKRLDQIGLQPKYNSSYSKILNGVDFGQAEILARSASASENSRDKLLYDFTVSYQRVANEMRAGVNRANIEASGTPARLGGLPPKRLD